MNLHTSPSTIPSILLLLSILCNVKGIPTTTAVGVPHATSMHPCTNSENDLHLIKSKRHHLTLPEILAVAKSGKKPTSISLLSGGERSMTAVALLFSIYMVKPSPFCVLDELDAPLDESNIGRFLKMLDRFIDQSQFVIVTHNKRTMNRADILYGVTQQEFGVSKLVGMQLTKKSDRPKPSLAKKKAKSSARS